MSGKPEITRTQDELFSLISNTPLTAIAVERAYQDRKWGGAPHDRGHTIPEWLLILQREVGEVAEAAGRLYWGSDDAATWDTRGELVQVAAVCVAMIDVLDVTEETDECQ